MLACGFWRIPERPPIHDRSLKSRPIPMPFRPAQALWSLGALDRLPHYRAASTRTVSWTIRRFSQPPSHPSRFSGGKQNPDGSYLPQTLDPIVAEGAKAADVHHCGRTALASAGTPAPIPAAAIKRHQHGTKRKLTAFRTPRQVAQITARRIDVASSPGCRRSRSLHFPRPSFRRHPDRQTG